MTEPKPTAADLPDEDSPAYDEPPAVPGDPLFEEDDTPEIAPAPDEDPQSEPGEVEDSLTQTPRRPIVRAEPLPEPAAQAEPDPEPAPEPEPQPEPEPAPLADPEPAPPPLEEPEPDTPDEMAAEAASEAIDDPHHDIFGPEPWDQAPPPKAAPEPEPAPPPPPPAWADIGPAPADAPVKRPAEPRRAAAAPIAAPGPEAATLEVKRSAFAVYLLYLSALVVVGIPLPIGAWLAYDRRKDAPAWLRSHYTYQIRTFWICMGGLALAAGVLFLPFALFPLTIVALVVWLVVRCFFGMVRLHRGEPIFNPQTWIV